jgi:hypothetical protein
VEQLTIKNLRRDPDALVAYGITLVAILFVVFAPDHVWHQALERIKYVVGVIGLPMLVTAGRYFVRGRAASAQGEALAADARRGNILRAVADYADPVETVDEPMSVTRAAEDGRVPVDALTVGIAIGIILAALLVAVLVFS